MDTLWRLGLVALPFPFLGVLNYYNIKRWTKKQPRAAVVGVPILSTLAKVGLFCQLC